MPRPATSRLKYNPPLGSLPVLQYCSPGQLSVDASYQRSMETGPSQALVRRIAQHWNWDLCLPLVVSRREGGGLFVVDGQHRLAAAALRGDIQQLPCVVTAYTGAADEAASFVNLNQNRRPLTALDLFRAALRSEDEGALAAMALIEGAGLRLAPHGNTDAWKPGMIANVGAVQDCLRVNGERPTRIALEVLAAAFKGQVLRYAGTLFPGIAGLVTDELRVEGEIDQAKLTAALDAHWQKHWVQQILIEQAASGARRSTAARAVVERAYRDWGKPQPAGAKAPWIGKAAAVAVVTGTGPRWCAQCERRVSADEAGSCTSSFCKARPA